MNSRRFHSKTRNGCVQCKRRKTKCDEEKPTCAKCVKREESCSFNDATSATGSPDQETAAGLSTSVTGSPRSHDTPNQESSSFNISAAYVLQGDGYDSFITLYHYGISTCQSIADSPETLPIWRDIVPALAFKYDFLFSGILAMSVLHLGLLHPSQVHTKTAMYHHTRGLQQISPHLLAITSENISALFAFSCLIPLYVLGSRSLVVVSDISRQPSLIEEIIGLFSLLRGIVTIVKEGRHWLEQGNFAPLLLPTAPTLSDSLPAQVEDALTNLRSHNDLLTQNTNLRSVYDAAITNLGNAFAIAHATPSPKTVILPFPISLHEDFMMELKGGSVMALVILAHYGVLLYAMRDHFWVRDCGKQIVCAVTELLDREEWSDCLHWPNEQVGMGETPRRIVG